jgi:two-component system cell cycle response regulator DivK
MSKQILVVDDNDKNRKLIRVMLQGAGFETLEAENGRKAIDIAKEQLPVLILMDIQMPVLDGILATRELKSDEVTRDIPIIALTSFAMKGDEERIMEQAEFDDYIAKPIFHDEFMHKIKHILGE